MKIAELMARSEMAMEMDVAKAARWMESPRGQQRDCGVPVPCAGMAAMRDSCATPGATSLHKGLVPPRGPGAHG